MARKFIHKFAELGIFPKLLFSFLMLPDIMFLDFKLPKMNGIEVCKRLKSDERTRHIPIIILSAKAQSFEIQQGLDAGADKYLCKPVSFPDILKEILTFETN
ncbi:MAG: response regulator [Proteobacteria bacterium]|nr:response regulator [Pseudomonadota bacterium]